MKLAVLTNSGEEIPVTKETLVGFTDNTEILAARREMLAAHLEEVNKKYQPLKIKRRKKNSFLGLRQLLRYLIRILEK